MADEFKTPPQQAAEVDGAASRMEALSLDKDATASTQANGGSVHAATTIAQTDGAAASQPQSGIKRVETHSADLKLPTSSTDAAVVSTPLGKPIESSKPKPAAAPTAEQQQKYNTLLAKVLEWTEVPDSTTAGAKVSPIQDYERMFLTRECLLRYLRATSWKVDQAEIRLRNTLAWRREYGTDKLTADYISPENETGKQVILGWDNDARPCCYLRPSKQNTERSDRQIEHLVYMLERTIDLMPPNQEMLALLINFAETKQGQGATLAQGKQTLNILQNHYPERLGRALVANVPWLIWGFFKLITPFIDPVTKEKIKFNEDYNLYVPSEQLMKEAGGKVNLQYDHAQYWPALTKLCEIKRNAYKERWEVAGKRIGEYEVYLRGGDQRPLVEVEASEKIA